MVVSRRRYAVAVTALGALLAACSSSSDGDGSSGSGPTDMMTGVANPNTDNDTAIYGEELQIIFPTMYAGFDGERMFRIPAVVAGMPGVTWSTTDVSYVSFENDPSTGGTLITTKKVGTVKIIARLGEMSGSADLNITQYNSADCQAGDDRYNNGIGFPDAGTGPAGMLAAFSGNTPKNIACSSCHGSGADFLSVNHTPQQTGGWTDQDLINIITKGYKPEGSVLVTMVPPQIYQRFHQWDVTEQEKVGIVCYLRSLTPESQGELDFGGLMPPTNGMPPGAAP